MSCSTSRSVMSSRRVGAGCPSRRHRREQRTRRASARHDRLTPLSSANVATSTKARAASLASSEGLPQQCGRCSEVGLFRRLAAFWGKRGFGD
ncbi:hypothetical protein Ctob_014974 [Chrysochromulina tobinii]|uniref:Uncharacterized protein n=1 Tax=Chrysochromulina tobinii TaxID=1460289 RepID=A0A0M0KS85_9EUKA|nr:hypothetical protein Ctob_014974 [Chrysochromulina tobinii]|eukprot:KOO41263.1 hypothetical protein Ctob_014974 [Chrysochromulina sp. CCMP291]